MTLIWSQDQDDTPRDALSVTAPAHQTASLKYSGQGCLAGKDYSHTWIFSFKYVTFCFTPTLITSHTGEKQSTDVYSTTNHLFPYLEGLK